MTPIRILIVLLPLLLAVPAAAASSITCKRVAVPAPAIRAEGMAEMVSDIVLSCSGGSAAAGALPQFEILVISNTPFANRTFLLPVVTPTDPLAPPATSPNTLPWNDAILLLDDPSPDSQVPCAPPAGADTCTAAASPYPNVFQGRQLQANTVLFRHVPINPPGDNGTRLIRISNLRVDATSIPATPTKGQMTAQVQIFTSSGDIVSIQDGEAPGGIAVPGYTFSVRTVADGAVSAVQAAVSTTPAGLSQTTTQSPTRFNVKFSEGFADAFRRRNAGTSGSDPLYVVSQPLPGANLHTETGFLNGAYPQQNSMNLAGLADSGTRLKLVIDKIPDNVAVYVSVRDTAVGTTGYSATAPKALLTSTDPLGGGLYSPGQAASDGLAPLDVQNGTAMAVWEVVGGDPLTAEDFSFQVVVAASPNHQPALGMATVRGTTAPTNATASTDPPAIPRFEEVITPDSAVPAFLITATTQTQNLISVSAASYAATGVAPESIVASFAIGIPPGSVQSSGLSTASGVSVSVIDSTGVKTTGQLIAVPANQVNYVLDKSTATGAALVNVSAAGKVIATGFVNVQSVAPGLFSADGSGHGAAVGQVARVGDSGNITTPLAAYDSSTSTWSTAPIDLGGGNDVNILTLYGTGMRRRSSLANVTLTIGGEAIPVLFVGAQTALPGVDLVSAGPLPLDLKGRGEVKAVLTVEGNTANIVTMQFR